jgi:hypothetical protein
MLLQLAYALQTVLCVHGLGCCSVHVSTWCLGTAAACAGSHLLRHMLPLLLLLLHPLLPVPLLLAGTVAKCRACATAVLAAYPLALML